MSRDAPQVAQLERMQFEHSEARRRFLVPRAALLGVFTGIVAALFRWLLENADAGRVQFFDWANAHGVLGFVACLIFSSVLAGVGVWVVKRFAPEAAGGGIPHLKGVLLGVKTMRPLRLLVVKTVGGILAMGSGLALGRQGPTMQMGGAAGALVAQFLHVSARDHHIFLAAGAAAGLSAAFHAPLAGIVFVLEEMRRRAAPGLFAAALVASLFADMVSRLLLGQTPTFALENTDAPSLHVLPAYLILGVLAGFLGVFFNKSLLCGLNFWRKSSPFAAFPGFAVGAIVGGVGFFAPQLLGSGQGLIESLLHAPKTALKTDETSWILWSLPLFLALRFALCVGSSSTGAAGGFFLPLLSIGAQLGMWVGLCCQKWLPFLDVRPQNLSIVGMAALFAASTRAPLTSIVLIMEMTNGYSLVLPLLTACLCAYGVADLLGDMPIYEAILERDLAMSAAPKPPSHLL